MSKRNVMSLEMYNFIKDNQNKLQYDLENGLIITPKGTNGTICSSTGYLRVKVNKKTLQVHQILAVKYFGEKCVGMQINHKDGNKLNNKINNLEISTQLENLKHQKDFGLLGKPNPTNKKKIDKFTINNEYVCTYESLCEACRDVGLKSPKSLRNCINGVTDTAGGYKWRYTE